MHKYIRNIRADQEKAYERVMGKLSLRKPREHMVRWLIDFSFRNLSSLSQQKWRDAQWAALAFAKRGGIWSVKIMQLPTKRDLIALQNWLISLWTNLAKGSVHSVDIEVKDWRGMLTAPHGMLHGQVRTAHLPWLSAFKYEVYESLTTPDVQAHVRFCLNTKCQHAFFADHKRQTYCSSSCSQSHRTRLWREKNREKFRATRKAAYKRKMESMLGQPIKIASRSKKGVST